MTGAQLEGLLVAVAGVGILLCRHGIARVYLRMRVRTAERFPLVGSAVRGQPGSTWEAFLIRWPLIVIWIVGIGWIMFGGVAVLGG